MKRFAYWNGESVSVCTYPCIRNEYVSKILFRLFTYECWMSHTALNGIEFAWRNKNVKEKKKNASNKPNVVCIQYICDLKAWPATANCAWFAETLRDKKGMKGNQNRMRMNRVLSSFHIALLCSVFLSLSVSAICPFHCNAIRCCWVCCWYVEMNAIFTAVNKINSTISTFWYRFETAFRT